MDQERIIILGASGHGKVVADILLSQNRNVIGFVDATRPIGELHYLDLVVLGREEDIPSLVDKLSLTHLMVAVGDNWIRSQICSRSFLPLASAAISPAALVSRSAQIGDGSILCPGVIVGPDCNIGRGCLLNTKSSLDHDSTMEAYSSLAPGATTGGNVQIGQCSAICMGVKIQHRIIIGEYCVIGASSFVNKNVADHSLAYGTPCKIIRERSISEKYL